MSETNPIACAIYRGGTSRGVFFHENDLPYSQAVRTQILLNIFGSPDKRQINGLGGATSVTSKAMIIGPSRDRSCGVEMLFGQVSIDAPLVDWGGTCGNLTSAIGPYAIDRGIVPAIAPVTDVEIYNVNTHKRVLAHVPVRDGRALTQGDFAIPGVPGTGARIDLEFLEPAGSFSGHLLPTGRPRESVQLDDGRSFTVSIVDAGNPVVFCYASELKMRGTELPAELEARRDVMETLEAIRSVACERLGIVASRAEATKKSPGLPKIGVFSAATEYDTLNGRRMKVSELDIVGRLLTMQTAHPSYMGAGAICTGAAAMVNGTIVNELCGAEGRSTGRIRIGHPQGVMDVSVKAALQDGSVKIASATIARTARRIMEGVAYVSADFFIEGSAPSR